METYLSSGSLTFYTSSIRTISSIQFSTLTNYVSSIYSVPVSSFYSSTYLSNINTFQTLPSVIQTNFTSSINSSILSSIIFISSTQYQSTFFFSTFNLLSNYQTFSTLSTSQFFTSTNLVSSITFSTLLQQFTISSLSSFTIQSSILSSIQFISSTVFISTYTSLSTYTTIQESTILTYNTIYISTYFTTPGVITNSYIVSGDRYLQLNWQPPFYSGGSNISKYFIYSDTNIFSTNYTVFTFSSLVNYSTYSYSIRPINTLNFIGPTSSTLKGIPIGSTISVSSLTASISSLLQNPSTLATNVAQLFTTFSLVSTNKTNLYTTTIQTVLSNTTNGSISSSIDVINSISQTISSAQVKEALIQTTTNILINNTTQEIASTSQTTFVNNLSSLQKLNNSILQTIQSISNQPTLSSFINTAVQATVENLFTNSTIDVSFALTSALSITSSISTTKTIVISSLITTIPNSIITLPSAFKSVLNTIIPSQTSTFTNSASVNIIIPQSTTITNIQTNNIQGNNQIPTYIPFLPNTPYSISSGLIQINFLYSTGTNTLYNTSDGSPITIGNTFRFSTFSLTIQAVGSVGFTLFQDPPIIGYIPQRFQYKKTVDSSLLLFNHVHNLKAKCCQ